MVLNFLSWYLFVSIFIIGVICGSFLNCVIWRFYVNESAAHGRSYCPKCRHKLSWYDLIPLFSFFLLQGKCRYCKKPISWQYPLIEALTGVVFVVVAWVFYPGIFIGDFSFLGLAKLFAYWAILSSLIVVFVTDIKWYLIPDGAVISGSIAAIFLNVLYFQDNYEILNRFDVNIIIDPFLAAFFSMAFFLMIFLISKGKWMGFGDVKYSFLMGLILGLPDVLIAIFLANFFGAIIGIGLITAGKKTMSSEIPFGPFLVVGTLAALFFSSPLLNWYLSLSF